MSVDVYADSVAGPLALDAPELAQARCLAYGLVADLFARGVTDATRDAVATSELLGRALEQYDANEPDMLAVEHEQAFGWAVTPFEGLYLDPERIIGGACTDRLWSLFREAGFEPDLCAEDVEHLATQLRCLAFLSGAEADAIEDGHTGAAKHIQKLSRRLLDEHLLRWVPVMSVAVRRLERPYPTALVDQIEQLLVHHRSSIAGDAESFALPVCPNVLDDERAGLREIGELLATPAHVGLVLTRADIRRLGRQHRIPRGFGERPQVLVNLLRSAARFDAFAGLIDALKLELDKQSWSLDADRYAPIHALTKPWIDRASATRRLLEQLRDGAQPIDP